MKKSNFNFIKLKTSKVKELLSYLEEVYGCKLDDLYSYDFFINSKNKVYVFSGNLDGFDMRRVNLVGLYFGTYHSDSKFRLSIEGSKFVNPKKNFVVLKEEFLKNYLASENLFLEEIEEDKSQENVFLIVKCSGENLGCVSKKDNLYINYVPKSRKLEFNRVF